VSLMSAGGLSANESAGPASASRRRRPAGRLMEVAFARASRGTPSSRGDALPRQASCIGPGGGSAHLRSVQLLRSFRHNLHHTRQHAGDTPLEPVRSHGQPRPHLQPSRGKSMLRARTTPKSHGILAPRCPRLEPHPGLTIRYISAVFALHHDIRGVTLVPAPSDSHKALVVPAPSESHILIESWIRY
jgi:hypothetical protein